MARGLTIAVSNDHPHAVEIAWLARGLKQPGGKLPLFDEWGQKVSSRTVRFCVGCGTAPGAATPASDAAMIRALSVGAASYRYVANHIAGADPHQQEDWNALGYLRFSVSLGLSGLWRMFKGYAGMTSHMLHLWRLTSTSRDGRAVPVRWVDEQKVR